MATCNNSFIEEDGFCSKCGQVHRNPTKKDPRKVAPSARREILQAEKRAIINDNIENKIQFKTVRDTINLLAQVFDVNIKVIFRNTKQSYFTTKYQNPVIVIGYESAERAFEKGFEEYATVQYLLNYRKPIGTEGSKFLAAHEFAHALVEARYPHNLEKSHGTTFKTVYKEIIDLVW